MSDYLMRDLLELMHSECCESLRLEPNFSPTVKLNGELHAVEGPECTEESIVEMLKSVVGTRQMREFRETMCLNMIVPHHGRRYVVRATRAFGGLRVDVEPVPDAREQMMKPEQKLIELGLHLPTPSRPAGNYVPCMEANGLLFISGQFPIENGKPRYVGRVGAELSEEDGYAAARLAALNVLAQIHSALGGFERLAHLVRMEGHVASAPGFNNQPKVLDGASDLFAAVLGERGRHARTAFSPDRLPWDLAVELVVVAAVVPMERGRNTEE